jgi:AcrR family transcriptional regulator
MRKAKREVKAKDVREEEIQEAAKELFYEKGYFGSTMESIAKKGNIAKGTIYRYYKNKDDLYISLMIPGTQKIHDNLLLLEEEIINNKLLTCREIIHGILECYYNVYLDDPDSIRIVAMFQTTGLFRKISRDTAVRLNRIAKKINVIIRRILVQGKHYNIIKSEVDEVTLPDIIFSLFSGIIQVEESRIRITEKDHLENTLYQAFDLLVPALCNNRK